MKILFCKWTSICETGIDKALQRLGHQVSYIKQLFTSVDYDNSYVDTLSDTLINNNFDCVFTVNFIPIVSRICNVFNIPYISWTVDSPSFQLYSETIKNKVNRIFIFDRTLYNKFYGENPSCIFYMSLGCDLESWDNVNMSLTDHNDYDCDISFIGSLYSEKCRYNKIENIPPYISGYVDGIIEAQLNVFGYNLIEDSIDDYFVQEFKKCADWVPLASDYYEDVKAIVAHTYIGYKCTEQERIRTLNLLSNHFNVDLYTLSDTSMLPHINVKGGADSRTMMPKIFKCSKINLNITARPIQSGLSLRVFDILGSGGFLLTNYQSELPEYFENGTDLVYYDSMSDLISKCSYYLDHEEERLEIAHNGYEKVKKHHSYDVKLQQILDIALG